MAKPTLYDNMCFKPRRLNTYPQGIFWVDARSRESSYRSFWDIGQAAALLGSNEPRNQDWDAASKYVSTVRKWLETQEGWLLVFDGLAFDNEDQVSEFVHLVPDQKGNCIIITSIDKTLQGRQRLLNPTSVKVKPLSPQDGSALLFASLDISKPSQTQKDKAMELVKHYEGLPLAIHAAAHASDRKGTRSGDLHTRSYGKTISGTIPGDHASVAGQLAQRSAQLDYIAELFQSYHSRRSDQSWPTSIELIVRSKSGRPIERTVTKVNLTTRSQCSSSMDFSQGYCNHTAWLADHCGPRQVLRQQQIRYLSRPAKVKEAQRKAEYGWIQK